MKYPKRNQYKYAKSQYRVRNWAEYEDGLQRGRGICSQFGAMHQRQSAPPRNCGTGPIG